MLNHALSRRLSLGSFGLLLAVGTACGSSDPSSPPGAASGGTSSDAAGASGAGAAGQAAVSGTTSGGTGGVGGGNAGASGIATGGLGGAMSGSSGNGGSGGAPAQPRTIQVLSYNIKLGSLSSLETIAEIILASNADVVGLQEVDKGTERSDGLDEPAVLAQLTGMQAFFAPALHDFDGGQYGEAALVSPELHVVQAIPHDLDQVNSGFETRSAIELRIATSAGAAQPDFVFISTHWEHIHNTGGDQNRAGQAEHVNRIGQAAAALAPALLVGDLNDLAAVLDSGARRLLSHRLDLPPGPALASE
jgi:endonuclease/exonuclease/phosphatase family metal-dependent hydrolase